jgi:phosphatidylglycerophosphate synthase
MVWWLGTGMISERRKGKIPDEDAWVLSCVRQQRASSYGGFIDAVCDKVYVVPCWILLLNTISKSLDSPWGVVITTFQYLTLLGLTTAEIASACVRFRAYFTSTGVGAPKFVANATGAPNGTGSMDFSTSAVTADHIGKAKQTFEMVGTALFCIHHDDSPPTTARLCGLVLLAAALPLAYESIRRKIIPRVMYVVCDTNSKSTIEHQTLLFWSSIKSLGSELVVGVVNSNEDDMKLAQIVPAVDRVILLPKAAPPTVEFMQQYQLDYFVTTKGKASEKQLSPDLIKQSRVLVVDPSDNTVRSLVPLKKEGKTE